MPSDQLAFLVGFHDKFQFHSSWFTVLLSFLLDSPICTAATPPPPTLPPNPIFMFLNYYFDITDMAIENGKGRCQFYTIPNPTKYE